MVRLWYGILGLLLFAPRLWAAPLSVSFPSQELEEGRTIRVVLSLDRPRPSLERLDLSPWSPWLVLERRGERQLNRNGSQTMVVWFTPRGRGELRLPPLSLVGQQGTVQGHFQGHFLSKVQSVQIHPARDPEGGEMITPRFPALPKQAWQRQQLIYAVSVDSPRPSLRLEADSIQADGFLLLPIPPQSQAMGEGAGRFYRHTSGWLIFPTRPGSLQLELPALRYIRNGVSSHRFYPPPLSLEVRALPEYLPPGVAVGGIALRGDSRPWQVQTVDELQNRQFAVLSHGIPSAWWRPPVIEVAEPGTIRLFESQPQVEQQIDASGLTVRYEYQQALSPQSWGWHRLRGRSRLYSFDPASGKLQTLDLDIQLPLALARWQEVLLGLMLLVLSWWTGRSLWQVTRVLYRRLSGYRAALRLLSGCEEWPGLRRVLARVAEAEGWHTNLGLGQWGERWRRGYPNCPLDDWLSDLQAALYGKHRGDVRQMGNALLVVLHKRLGIWRWVCEFRLRAETSQ